MVSEGPPLLVVVAKVKKQLFDFLRLVECLFRNPLRVVSRLILPEMVPC